MSRWKSLLTSANNLGPSPLGRGKTRGGVFMSQKAQKKTSSFHQSVVKRVRDLIEWKLRQAFSVKKWAFGLLAGCGKNAMNGEFHRRQQGLAVG
jgi:hypothetical protein